MFIKRINQYVYIHNGILITVAEYTLAVKVAPGVPVMAAPMDIYGHDPDAALFKDGELIFCVEEERFSRRKHAIGEFPEGSIRACFELENISMSDISSVVIPYEPSLLLKSAPTFFTEMSRTGTSLSRKG